MRVLEIYYGTGSFSHAIREVFPDAEIVGVDITEYPECTDICDKFYKVDILNWVYRNIYPKGYFDIIWASVPCFAFSVATIGRNWNKEDKSPKNEKAELGLALLDKALAIINFYRPKYWFIENPRGMMRKMPCMQNFDRITVTYCQYGDTRMKPTDIWGTIPSGFPVRCCKNGDPCHDRAPRGTSQGTQGIKGTKDRSRIPHEFCLLMAKAIKDDIEGIKHGLNNWY